MNPSKIKYLKTLSAELLSQAERVRLLIGSKHWLSDGKHKEHILQSLLRRYCPDGVEVTSGFVASSSNINNCSTEQDILIVDTRKEKPIFTDGGLSIVFPEFVLAAISVKSAMNKKSVIDSIEGLKTVREVFRQSGQKPDRVWCGAYFFSTPAKMVKTKTVYSWIETELKKSPLKKSFNCNSETYRVGPDILVEARNLVFIINGEKNTTTTENVMPTSVKGFSCDKVSSAVFVAELIQHLNHIMHKEHSVLGDFVTSEIFKQLDPPSKSFNVKL